MHAMAFLGLISFLVAVGLGFHYASMVIKLGNFSALQAENVELKVEEKNLEVSNKKLDMKLSDLETMSENLASMMQTSGIGGSAIDRPTSDLLREGPGDLNIELMKDRVNELESHLGTLQTKMELRIRRARITPSIWPINGPILSPFWSKDGSIR